MKKVKAAFRGIVIFLLCVIVHCYIDWKGMIPNGIQRVRALLRIPIYLMGHTCYA